jgi:hypothetical protein
MVAETQEKYKHLVSELAVLYEDYTDDLNTPDRRLLLIADVLEPLKQKLPGYTFDSDENEIRFYKETFPDLLSLFIYYTEKSALGTSELIGTRKSITEYRNRLMKRIEDFSTENAPLYDYYSMRRTHFDSYYFLRSSPLNQEPALLFGALVDPKICPGFSIKIAMISAYRKLDYILCEVANQHQTGGAEGIAVSSLHWTGTKRDLTELVYAMKKYVNNGKVQITDVVKGFQYLFNTDLGNYRRIYQEILSRKKSESFFLNQLVDDHRRKMEEDENERLRKRGFR